MQTHSPFEFAAHEAQTPLIVRLPKVRQITGLGRSTIYRLMALKQFPSAVQLGPRAVGWHMSEINAWSENRPRAAH